VKALGAVYKSTPSSFQNTLRFIEPPHFHLGSFIWIVAILGHVAKLPCFWSISSSIVVVFGALLKDFGSPSSLVIFFLCFVGVS